jgi:hypothetical protein
MFYVFLTILAVNNDYLIEKQLLVDICNSEACSYLRYGQNS